MSEAQKSPYEMMVEEIEARGIYVPVVAGTKSVREAWERVNGTDDEQIIATICCRHVASRAWRAAGLPSFYKFKIWLRIRYMALAKYGNRCQCCGAGPKDGVVLHVDHIKPKSKHPELALSLANMQVLCADCNAGKSNKDESDWRDMEPGV